MTEKRGDETRHLLSYSSVCATRHLMIVLHAIFCLQVIFGNLSSRNCPQYFGTGPIDQGGTRHGGSALGSRELLCLFGRISGTLACYSSLSELCLPGESASCRMQGESAAGGVTSFYRLASRGGFSGGLGTSRRRRVIQGHDKSSRCRLQVQGPDTSRRCRLTGARHITSLPPTRVQCPLCGYPSASFYLRRFSPLFLFRRGGSFFLTDSPYLSRAQLTHLRPGPSGVTGFMGSLLDLMRRNWGC